MEAPMQGSAIEEKVAKFEWFMNDVLKEDLKQLNIQHNKKAEEISEWVQLKTLINTITDNNMKTFKGKMDIGCNIFAQVEVPNTSNVVINLGANVYAEFTLKEALTLTEARIKLYEQQLDAINDACCEIKGRIKLVLHGIQELTNIK